VEVIVDPATLIVAMAWPDWVVVRTEVAMVWSDCIDLRTVDVKVEPLCVTVRTEVDWVVVVDEVVDVDVVYTVVVWSVLDEALGDGPRLDEVLVVGSPVGDDPLSGIETLEEVVVGLGLDEGLVDDDGWLMSEEVVGIELELGEGVLDVGWLAFDDGELDELVLVEEVLVWTLLSTVAVLDEEVPDWLENAEESC
jgi:hypothetical protein